MSRRDQVVAAVIAAEPSLTPTLVAAAMDATITTGAALRHLADALAVDPDVLHSGAPPVVGRLVGALVAAGSTTLTLPGCVRCGRTGRPLFRSQPGGVCAACRRWQLATVCSECGKVKPVAGRSATGDPVCEVCRRTRQRRCGICAHTASMAVAGRDGQPDVCVNCYRLPQAVCGRCGRQRPCNFADGDRPVCKACAPRTAVACAHCGNNRPATARWPEGPVCEPCYRTALQRRGPCQGCQQTRRLIHPPGPAATRCTDCAGTALPGRHRCTDCGTEDRLFERGRCARCALARRTTRLLAAGQAAVPAALEPIYEAIIATPQPYSALNWIHKGAGAQILSAIAAGQMVLSHEALDGHPQRAAADYLRRLLTAHQVLDDRNEDLVRTHRWTGDLLAGITRPADRLVVAAYANWRVLRRLRRRAEQTTGPHTPTRRARTQLRATVDLLDWLATHDQTLATTSQADIDGWLATGPAAGEARDFLLWAAEHDHCLPLTIPTTGRRSGTSMPPDRRWAVLARLLHDDTINLTDRVAGCLLLCYAQPLSRLTAMTADQVGCRPHSTTIRFGTDPIIVPDPLDGLLREHINTRPSHIGVGSPVTSQWLFPGHLPGRPLTPARLSQRLNHLGINAHAGRRAALLHLAAQLPAAVLADLLHLAPGTAVGWVGVQRWRRLEPLRRSHRHS